VGNCRIFERDTDHLCPGQFRRPLRMASATLALPCPKPTPTLPRFVPDDNQGAEIESATTFDDFRGTIDENDLLGQFLLIAKAALTRFRCWSAAPATAWGRVPVVFVSGVLGLCCSSATIFLH